MEGLRKALSTAAPSSSCLQSPKFCSESLLQVRLCPSCLFSPPQTLRLSPKPPLELSLGPAQPAGTVGLHCVSVVRYL